MLMLLGAACGNVSSPKVPDAASVSDAAPDAPPDAASGPPPAAPTGVSLSRATEIGALGDIGGDLFSDACPAGQALVGLSGANGVFNSSLMITVVGQVIAHCAVVGVGSANTDKTYPLVAGAATLLPPRGTGTGTAYSMQCPANQFVVGLQLRSGSALDQVNLQCAPVKLVPSGTGWIGEVGATTLVTKAGGDGGAGPLAATCPAGQIATITHTRVIAGTSTVAGLLSGVMIGCRTVLGK